MNNKKIISIGIPAYNEERVLGRLLDSLRMQSIYSSMVKEVIIEIDGSTDNTYEIASIYKAINPQIKVYRGRLRRGKSSRLNHILRTFKGEILVLIDSDVTLASKNTLKNLILPILYGKTDLTYGSKEYKSIEKSIVSHISITREKIWRAMRDTLNNGNNIYNCSGSFTALSKKYSNLLNFPKKISSDNQYIYLNALSNKIMPRFIKNAIVHAYPTSNLSDFISQNIRLRDEFSPMLEIFGNKYLSEYKLPLIAKWQAMLTQLIKNPVLGLYAVLFDLLIKFYPGNHNNHLWEIANTTKDLI